MKNLMLILMLTHALFSCQSEEVNSNQATSAFSIGKQKKRPLKLVMEVVATRNTILNFTINLNC
jgi:hypothetical protein